MEHGWFQKIPEQPENIINRRSHLGVEHCIMPIEVVGDVPSPETVFKLRAKMEDNTYTLLEEKGERVLAFRVPGDEIDLLRSLEYLAEFLSLSETEGVEKLVLISDKGYELTPFSVLAPKLKSKKADDDELFKELKGKIAKKHDPLVFTAENDMLELYRIAIALEGSFKSADNSTGLELLKVELPREGEVIYLIFDDGYRKMNRKSFERLVDDSMASLRGGLSLAKDATEGQLSRESGAPEPKERAMAAHPSSADAPERPLVRKDQWLSDPKVVLRELVKDLSEIGYRKDSVFSRQDVNQLFMIGLRGPALFVKFLEEGEDLSGFTRVLEHRPDATGLLMTKTWRADLEALSRIKGFIYLEMEHSRRAMEIIREILKTGGQR